MVLESSWVVMKVSFPLEAPISWLISSRTIKPFYMVLIMLISRDLRNHVALSFQCEKFVPSNIGHPLPTVGGMVIRMRHVDRICGGST